MNVYIIAYTAHIIISHPPGLPVNTSIYIRLNTEYTPSITAHTLLFANWIPSPSPTTITTSNMTNTLKEIPESEIMGIVEDYSSTSVKELTLKIISVRLADIVLTAIVYILIMVVVFIALRIIISATGIVRRLPVIKQADKIGGVVVGFIEGLVVVWIFFTIVTAISGTETASNILLQIHGNTFLEALYNYNPITRVLFSTIR